MKTGASRLFGRSIILATAGILAVVLMACTGSGGGYLPPDTVFTGRATFSFNFSCEDKGGINPPTGQLRLQLTYTDHGTGPLFDSPFSIQGTADRLDPVVESMFCIRAESAGARPEPADLRGPLPADDTAAGGFPANVPEA